MKKYLLLLLIGFITKSYSQEKFSVYFDFDIHEVNQDSKQKLADWISKNKDAEILKVYGYCDSVGSNSYNDKLALRRANFVLKTLKNNRMKLIDQLEVKGFGKRFEQSKNQADNRRVDIYFRLKEEKMSDKIVQLKVGDKLRLKNLNFYNRSGVVLPKSEPVLVELLQIMKQNPKLKIEIQGHICCQPQGDVEDISTLRCKTVYNYLVENGIDKNRLSYNGYGNTMPLYPIPERNEFEQDENRRVEIQILEN
ncbi:MAG TPA: OmpA family protein [Flavobacterium sp.]|uniref:OmpA family protein n=1 Tax=Flavobacterium sp. TaxID=239 RepID=UPI002BD721E6|nr:OmpA family protein [Flavobacterium sp.]HSD14204.1 OmpA family protein [Flavobacterium sp.]